MDTIDTPEIITGTDALYLKLAPDVDWRMRSHDRLFGGLITGASASGKTTMARRIVLGAVEAGLRVSLCDPISRDPFFTNGSSHCSSTSQIREILQRTAEVELLQRRDRYQDIQAHNEGRLIVVDHFEQFLADQETLRWVELIIRTGSKLGVAIILSGQFQAHHLTSACRTGNLLALSWRARHELVTFGARLSEVPHAPAYHLDPVTGQITGFEPRT